MESYGRVAKGGNPGSLATMSDVIELDSCTSNCSRYYRFVTSMNKVMESYGRVAKGGNLGSLATMSGVIELDSCTSNCSRYYRFVAPMI